MATIDLSEQIFSDNGLLGMHKAIRDALVIDDKLREDHKLYDVRNYSDWKTWGDALESALTDRGVPFEKIAW